MKKIMIGLIILTIITFNLAFLLGGRYLTLKDSNAKLSKQIKESTENKESTTTDNDNLKTEIAKIKEEIKAKLEEYQIWEETKEKIINASK